jgi:hypothetical protein
MPTISQTVDIDFDLDEIFDDDLAEELEGRGYTVYKDSTGDLDLIDMIQNRGYTVYGKLYDKDRELQKLYTTYQTTSPEFFEKELKKYFREHLDVNIY